MLELDSNLLSMFVVPPCLMRKVVKRLNL